MKHTRVLIVYTGGTIGMVQDENGSLHPFALDRIYDAVPQLRACSYGIDSVMLDHIIDSSNMTPALWVDIANIIEREYDRYDGFVVLHGTDTMAYTASALSFMLSPSLMASSRAFSLSSSKSSLLLRLDTFAVTLDAAVRAASDWSKATSALNLICKPSLRRRR